MSPFNVKGVLGEANGNASVGQDAIVNSTACQLHDSIGAAACCGSRVLLHPACRTSHGRAAAARVLGSSLDFTTSPMGDLRAFENVDGKKCKRSTFAGHSARARRAGRRGGQGRHGGAPWRILIQYLRLLRCRVKSAVKNVSSSFA